MVGVVWLVSVVVSFFDGSLEGSCLVNNIDVLTSKSFKLNTVGFFICLSQELSPIPSHMDV